MEENKRVAIGDQLSIRIEKLGGLGDGTAQLGEQTVFVPYSYPGDLVRVLVEKSNAKLIRASILEIEEPAAARQGDVCQHFGQCGGCDLQQLPIAEYFEFKKKALQEAVSRSGFSPELVEDPVNIGPRSRRVVQLKVEHKKGKLWLGFYKRASHTLVPISACPVMEKELEELIPPLAMLMQGYSNLFIQGIRLALLDNGIDVLIDARKPLKAGGDQEIKEFCAKQIKVVRFTWKDRKPSLVFEREKPIMRFGKTAVAVPAGSFLQASRKGQSEMTRMIIELTANSTRIADLYSGSGTYTFPLLESGHHVTAFEGDRWMVRAAEEAVKGQPFEDRASFEQRNLLKDPVSGVELNDFDAVVINPPRNGAESQMTALALSKVPLIILVSCNPRTLERDAKHLSEQGYKLETSVPIDQFYWTVHLESVSLFRLSE
jgi:23S rRNA (uracil1939-C5)-methyltransferase